MLIKGDDVPRQAPRGLMWLTLARDAAFGAQTFRDRQPLSAMNGE